MQREGVLSRDLPSTTTKKQNDEIQRKEKKYISSVCTENCDIIHRLKQLPLHKLQQSLLRIVCENPCPPVQTDVFKATASGPSDPLLRCIKLPNLEELYLKMHGAQASRVLDSLECPNLITLTAGNDCDMNSVLRFMEQCPLLKTAEISYEETRRTSAAEPSKQRIRLHNLTDLTLSTDRLLWYISATNLKYLQRRETGFAVALNNLRFSQLVAMFPNLEDVRGAFLPDVKVGTHVFKFVKFATYSKTFEFNQNIRLPYLKSLTIMDTPSEATFSFINRHPRIQHFGFCHSPPQLVPQHIGNVHSLQFIVAPRRWGVVDPTLLIPLKMNQITHLRLPSMRCSTWCVKQNLLYPRYINRLLQRFPNLQTLFFPTNPNSSSERERDGIVSAEDDSNRSDVCAHIRAVIQDVGFVHCGRYSDSTGEYSVFTQKYNRL